MLFMLTQMIPSKNKFILMIFSNTNRDQNKKVFPTIIGVNYPHHIPITLKHMEPTLKVKQVSFYYFQLLINYTQTFFLTGKNKIYYNKGLVN